MSETPVTIEACIDLTIHLIKVNQNVTTDRTLRHTLKILEWVRDHAEPVKAVNAVFRAFPGATVVEPR